MALTGDLIETFTVVCAIESATADQDPLMALALDKGNLVFGLPFTPSNLQKKTKT